LLPVACAAAAVAAEHHVRETIEIVRHAGDGRKAPHHEEQRQGGDLAVGQKASRFRGKCAERRRKSNEQSRAADGDQAAAHRRADLVAGVALDEDGLLLLTDRVPRLP